MSYPPISNETERRIARDLSDEGFRVLNRGWPDFLVFNDSVIRFVEVKATCRDPLSPHQKQVADVLARLGVKVEVRAGMCVCQGDCRTPFRLSTDGELQYSPWRDAILAAASGSPRWPSQPSVSRVSSDDSRMTTTRTPRTKAGKALLIRVHGEDGRRIAEWAYEEDRQALVAIEEETVSEYREALRELLVAADEMDDGITEHGWAIRKARSLLQEDQLGTAAGEE